MKSVTKTKRKKKQTIKNVELNSKEGQSDSIACNCAACDEVCLNHPETDDEQSIICNVCNLWYHKGCTSLTPTAWRVLNKNENIIYSCDTCVRNKGRATTDFEKIKNLIEQNQQENRKFMKNLESELFAKVDKTIDEKLKVLNEKNETTQAQLSNMIKEVKNTEINIESKIKTQVQMYMENKNEKEDKKNNLIIHKLPESNVEEKEQLEKDKQEIIKILEITNPELKTEIASIVQENKNIMRLGEKKETARPIKIVLPNVSTKHKIFKGCKNLKDSVYNRISIQSDLTIEEQERNFKLRNDLRQKLKDGEDVCIFRGKIIQKSEHPNNQKKKTENENEKKE